MRKSCENNKRDRLHRSSNSSESPSPISKYRKPNSKMEELLEEIKATRNEVKESERRITEKLQPLRELDSTIEGMKNKLNDLETGFRNVQEDNTRKNIIVFGYPEKHKEGWREMYQIVQDLSRKLRLDRNIDFDNAFRLGIKMHGKRRPVMIKLLRTFDKFEILSLSKNLKGTSISIEEDFSPEERKVKSLLRKKAFELRKSFPEMRTRVIVRKNELWTNIEGSSTIFEVTPEQEIKEKHTTFVNAQITGKAMDVDPEPVTSQD